MNSDAIFKACLMPFLLVHMTDDTSSAIVEGKIITLRLTSTLLWPT